MIIPDENADEQVRAYEAERMPVFTNEAKIASSEIFTLFIEQANAEKPDLILFGGDILDFPSEKNITFLKDELEKNPNWKTTMEPILSTVPSKIA